MAAQSGHHRSVELRVGDVRIHIIYMYIYIYVSISIYIYIVSQFGTEVATAQLIAKAPSAAPRLVRPWLGAAPRAALRPSPAGAAAEDLREG